MVRSSDDPNLTDRAEALMREVGAQLREVRRERGEDLDEVAAYLRIKPQYLYGIERGDMAVMPGRTYALGFLRTYADYLGFDGEDLIEQIKSTVGDLTGRTRFHIRAPVPEGRVPKMPLLVASLAMIAGIYAGWAYINRDDQAAVQQIPPVPAELRPMPPAPEQAPDTGATLDPAAPEVVEAAPEPEAVDTPPVTGPEVSADAAAPPEVVGAEEDARLARDQAAASLDEAPILPDDATRSVSGDQVAGEEPRREDLSALEPAAGPERAETPPDDGETQLAEATGGDEIAAAPEDAAAEPAEAEETAAAPEDAAAEPAEVEETAAGTGNEDLIATLLADLPDTAGEGQVYETVNADARVILRATGQSWVQIRSLSGDYLRTRTLQRGDTFLVPNRDDLVMWTGNAGAVEFVVDGEPVAPLGPDGSVMRDIPLEPAALLERARQPG
jgi:cytoskeleton protein RodZ